MGKEESKRRQLHADRNNVRRAQSCSELLPFFYLLPQLLLREEQYWAAEGRVEGAVLAFSKEDRKTPKFCPPTPKWKAKIAKKTGHSHKASPKSSSLWQKLHHSKK